MAHITLDFLNKNMYRKYPFKSTSSHVFTNGIELPQKLITAIQISTTYTYRRIYISKIWVKDNFISLLIRDKTTDVVLGSFSGKITKKQQTLFLNPMISEISGKLVIGDPDALSLITGTNYFSAVNGELEESTIFCFTPPAVRSIIHNDQIAIGIVTLTGNNLTIMVSTPDITLSVINTASILSNVDRSAEAGNCLNPLIKQINTVLPDNNGNIDIFGIKPIQITVTDGKIALTTTDLTINDVCPDRIVLSPPVDMSDEYYTDILNNQIPEWRSWPQFNE